MSKFKVGDRVRKENGKTFSNGELVLTVSMVEKDGTIWFAETDSHLPCHFLTLSNVYPKPPHKHRDLIIEWANGADIQVMYHGNWVDQFDPDWEDSWEYRIKPQKSERDIEIENIQKQMDELKERLEKLKGEES